MQRRLVFLFFFVGCVPSVAQVVCPPSSMKGPLPMNFLHRSSGGMMSLACEPVILPCSRGKREWCPWSLKKLVWQTSGYFPSKSRAFPPTFFYGVVFSRASVFFMIVFPRQITLRTSSLTVLAGRFFLRRHLDGACQIVQGSVGVERPFPFPPRFFFLSSLKIKT